MSVIQEAAFAADPVATLKLARSGEEVLIEGEDGAQFVVTLRRKAATPKGRSPLDVGTVPGLHLTIDEINDIIQAGRERR